MAFQPHDADNPAVPHNPDSPDVAADAWALVRAHVMHDDEAAQVIIGGGCPACIARFAAGMLSGYLERFVTDRGGDPAGLADIAGQMSRDALTPAGD
jgi:hypothetical protein